MLFIELILRWISEFEGKQWNAESLLFFVIHKNQQYKNMKQGLKT